MECCREEWLQKNDEIFQDMLARGNEYGDLAIEALMDGDFQVAERHAIMKAAYIGMADNFRASTKHFDCHHVFIT